MHYKLGEPGVSDSGNKGINNNSGIRTFTEVKDKVR
jgi:hypothetical protein